MTNAVTDIFFARVETHDAPFNPAEHARSDLTVMSAVFSQVRGQAGSINLNIVQPPGGIMSGPRWGILSAVIGGELRQVARGQIVGYPLTLDGEEIGIELSCMSPSTSSDVDALFMSHDAEVPDYVEPSLEPRRTAPYLLADPYVDPVTLEPVLDPIAGSAAPALTLYGAGADPDVATILGVSIGVSDMPVKAVNLTERTSFTHREFGKVDLGAAMAMSTPLENRSTYTPLSLSGSIESMTLDGGFQLLGTKVEYDVTAPLRVYTKKRKVDPFTCIITPAEYVEYHKNTINNLEITALVEATQDREETLDINVRPLISEIFGAVSVTETTSLQNADELAETTTVINYTTYRQNFGFGGGLLATLNSTTRFGTAPSIWKQSGALRASCIPSLDAIVRRAARIAVERAHCVDLTIQTVDPQALNLTLKDRVKVFDTRLPGGVAVGKVTGLQFAMEVPSAVTKIILSCPVSDPANLSSVAAAGTDGLASVDIPRVFSSTTPTIHSDHMQGLIDRNAGELVRYIEFTDDSREQESVMGITNDRDTQLEFPDDQMPQTGIRMELMDLSPVDQSTLPEVKLRLNDVTIRLPEGISI